MMTSAEKKMEEKQETLVTLEVPTGQRADTRLDVYLTRFMQNATRTRVQRGIREGRVAVNGKQVKASYVVQPGDVITCVLLRPPPIEAAPEDIPLDIIFEDEYLIVLDKPAGMVVHPAYGNRTGTLVNALLHHVGAGPVRLDVEEEEEESEDGEEDGIGLSTATAAPVRPGDVSIRPGIVHRLDKDTSGLIVVARDDYTHARLAQQFMDRTIRRIYLSILWGAPDPPEGRIEAPVGRDPRDRKRMAVVSLRNGKHAATRYRVLEVLRHTAMVEFRLETGRTHQIRVHARHIGHPVLGDATYDGQRIRCGPDTAHRRAFFAGLFKKMPRQALHAHTLGFTHPHTGEMLDFVSPLPEDMAHVLERLRSVEGADRQDDSARN